MVAGAEGLVSAFWAGAAAGFGAALGAAGAAAGAEEVVGAGAGFWLGAGVSVVAVSEPLVPPATAVSGE